MRRGPYTNGVGPYPYSLAPGSDWDLRLLREHRETLALDSGLPARLVFLPFLNYLRTQGTVVGIGNSTDNATFKIPSATFRAKSFSYSEKVYFLLLSKGRFGGLNWASSFFR